MFSDICIFAVPAFYLQNPFFLQNFLLTLSYLLSSGVSIFFTFLVIYHISYCTIVNYFFAMKQLCNRNILCNTSIFLMELMVDSYIIKRICFPLFNNMFDVLHLKYYRYILSRLIAIT